MDAIDGTAELVNRSAVDLARLLRDGELGASELLQAHLDHIAVVNPTLNAIVTLTEEAARRDAAAADQRQVDGEALGLLHGLPIVHKDLADTAGVRTTHGSLLLADHVPTTDALIVERAKRAGAISIGKSNTPEFGAGSQTFNAVFGPTRNPWDHERTCGGSSGGAAVALAARMTPLADGSDMGGSLRNPASFCNVVGFRPSPGRVPSWPKASAWTHLSTEGPMARTVDDVALLLAAQAGPDRRSPIALETAGATFAPPIAHPAAPLRVAWAPDLGGLPIDASVREALRSVPATFEELGHHVVEAHPDLTDAFEIFATLRAWNFALGLADTVRENPDVVKETVRWNVELGLEQPVEAHHRAFVLREKLYQRVVAFFESFDVLLCPTVQVPPFPVSTEWVSDVDGTAMTTYIEWMRSCTDVTVMNCPAISVPAGFTPDGLPVGLQIVGPPRDDLGVLSVAAQYTATTALCDRQPPTASLDG